MVGTGLAEGLRQRAALGEVCYLIDGLDEVGDAVAQERVHDLLVALAESRPLCPVVVTSRPVEAQSYELGAYTRIGLRPLDPDQQAELLELRLGIGRDDAEAWLSRWREQPTLAELARNPLFLTLLALTDGNDAGSRDAASANPTRPHAILDRVVDWLIEGKHRPQPTAWPKALAKSDVAEALALLAFAWTRTLHDVEPRASAVAFFAEGTWREELPSAATRRSRIETAVDRVAAAFAGDWGALVAKLAGNGILSPFADDSPFAEERVQFAHRMLQENLASRAVADRWQAAADEREELWRLAQDVSQGEGRQAEHQLRFWAEPFALMAGRVGDPGPDAIVQSLVGNPATRPIGLRALVNAHRLQPDTIAGVVASLDDWEDRRRVFDALVERVPERDVVPLVARLGRGTREGNDLFFLHLLLERLIERGGTVEREARVALAELFDHLEPDAEAMRRAFTHVPGRPDHPAFAAIPTGVFDMGDEDEGRFPGVHITEPFWIGTTAVTVGQYRLFDPGHRSRMLGEETPVVAEREDEQARRDAFPVVDVTWFATVSFTRWVTRWQAYLPRETSGLPAGHLVARLPSEAQWEHAARAGTATRFWFGDSDEDAPRHGRVRESWGKGPFPVGTASQGSKPPSNRWRLLEVHGGVWEWCSSVLDGERTAEHVEVTASASARVLRGGSFDDDPGSCRSAYRDWNLPAYAVRDNGFRVVLAARPQLGRSLDDRS